jgi:sulfate adenylyltransferase
VGPNAEAPDGLLVDPARAARLSAASVTWPSLTLDPIGLADVELLLIGAGPPGGAGPALVVPAALAAGLAPGTDVALRDAEGVMIAALRLDALAAVPGAPTARLTGRVEGVSLPRHPDYPALRLTPAAARTGMRRRGWFATGGPDPVAVWIAGPPTTRDVDAVRGLLASGTPGGGRGVLVLVPVGGEDPADAAFHLRIHCVRAALAELPADRVMLVAVPLVPGPADDDRAAAVARAYGAPVAPTGGQDAGRDQAARDQATLRDLLRRGAPLPAGLVPPVVAAALARAHPPRHRRGFTVLFTGLSGSGKSTLANLLVVRLLERDTSRRVTALDGDVVRLHLSKGLGFSRADRDANVERIGFVAAQVTAAGGIAVCAPIAPYDATRRRVREMVERGGGFVLVHVATPLDVCEARDRKGLYAKARAGLIAEFTGISDPYEPPADAEIVIDTAVLGVSAGVERVLAHLTEAGWILPDQ